MLRICTKCGKDTYEDILVRCEVCRGDLVAPETYHPPVSQETIQQITKRVWRRAYTTISGFLLMVGILTFIGFNFSMKSIYEKGVNNAQDQIEELIISKFSEDNINSTISTVAEEQANHILRRQIEPDIQRFRDEVKDNIQSLDIYVNNLKDRYDETLKKMSTEVADLSLRNELAATGDLAVSEGDRSAFDRLYHIYENTSDEIIRLAALSEILRVKAFWAGMTKNSTNKLISKNRDESDFKDEDFSSIRLTLALTNKDVPWTTRALAAKELGNRDEKFIPEILVQAIKSDPHLEVVKNAATSFEKITDFKSADIFGIREIPEWWEINRETFLGNLNKD